MRSIEKKQLGEFLRPAFAALFMAARMVGSSSALLSEETIREQNAEGACEDADALLIELGLK